MLTFHTLTILARVRKARHRGGVYVDVKVRVGHLTIFHTKIHIPVTLHKIPPNHLDKNEKKFFSKKNNAMDHQISLYFTLYVEYYIILLDVFVMDRLPLNYSKIPDLRVLTAEDLQLIHYKARGLSEQEILDYIGVTEEMLGAYEMSVFRMAYRRGRAEGIVVATENLFSHMKTKAGGASCLAYLQQMSSNFKSVSVSPNSSMPSGFSFQVVMEPEEKQESSQSSSSSQRNLN